MSGTSITEYARSRHISKWKAGLHRSLPAFPQPVGVGGGERRIRYYDVDALDEYFEAVKGLEPKKVEGSMKPASLWTIWSQRPRPGGLAED